MNWLLVARQTLRTAHRERELYSIVGALAVVYGAFGLFYGGRLQERGYGTLDFLTIPTILTVLLLPGIGLLLGQGLVTGPRSDGRLRLVLGQPVSRVDVLVGGYVAKALILLAGFLAGAVALVLAVRYEGGQVDLAILARFLAGAALLALAYLGLAVAASAVCRSPRVATYATFGSYMTFVLFWRFAPRGIELLALRLEAPERVFEALPHLAAVSPSVAFENLVHAAFGSGLFPVGVDALYGQPTAIALLAVWIVVVPAVGLWRFCSTDL